MQELLMPDSAHDHRLVAEFAGARLAHGHHISPGQAEQAAALPADLWAARPGITPDHWGYHAHLPRAAFDTISAPPRRPPAGHQRRPQPWQHRQEVDR
ncbi:MAG TPA: hypothetical protein VGM21_11900 [Actinomycetota bacterium]|jgi:hypothetical protein